MFKVPANAKFIILYNNDEWEYHCGTLEEVIKYLKYEEKFNNYGRHGAMIISYNPIYSIDKETVEKTHANY